MKNRIAIFVAGGMLAACSTPPVEQGDRSVSAPAPTARPDVPREVSGAHHVDGYKRDLALRIAQMNAAKVYSGRPQALLRSVVVLRYTVDANGNLVTSEIQRSNRDRVTEATALASLRNSAPFPKPAPHLLRNGRLEMSETWLFNNDGRFQLRTIAEPQMDQ